MVSIIILVKLGRRLNITNKIKGQRRLSDRLATDMFRGTPYMFKDTKYQNILILICFYHIVDLNLKHFQIIEIFLKNWKKSDFKIKNFENLLKVELKTKILGYYMTFLNTDIVAQFLSWAHTNTLNLVGISLDSQLLMKNVLKVFAANPDFLILISLQFNVGVLHADLTVLSIFQKAVTFDHNLTH